MVMARVRFRFLEYQPTSSSTTRPTLARRSWASASAWPRYMMLRRISVVITTMSLSARVVDNRQRAVSSLACTDVGATGVHLFTAARLRDREKCDGHSHLSIHTCRLWHHSSSMHCWCTPWHCHAGCEERAARASAAHLC